MPVHARAQGPIKPIGGETWRSGLPPRQHDRVAIRLRDPKHHRRRRFGHAHVIHIPPIHHHRRIRHDPEAQPEVRRARVSRQIQLFARHSSQVARVGRHRRRQPRGAAVGRNLHVAEVVARFQGILMLETQRGPSHSGEVKRPCQSQGGVGVIGIKGAGAIGRGMSRRGIVCRGEAPGTARHPIRQAVLEVVIKRQRRRGTGACQE